MHYLLTLQVSRYCILTLHHFTSKQILHFDFAEQCSTVYPANTTRWNNDVLMLAQRLQRWPNIKTSFFQHDVFGGNYCKLYLIPVVRTGGRTHEWVHPAPVIRRTDDYGAPSGADWRALSTDWLAIEPPGSLWIRRQYPEGFRIQVK